MFMTTLTATAARSCWFSMLKNIKKSHRVYQIASKEGDAVLLSKEDYDSLLETLELMAIPGMRQSIKQARKEIKTGKVYSVDEVFGA
jgi:antitoxin YefM